MAIRNDRPYDRWIKSQSDRCSICGYHPQTQGHDPDCPRSKDRKKARRG